MVTTLLVVSLLFLLFLVVFGIAGAHDKSINPNQFRFLLYGIGGLLIVFVVCFVPNDHIRWDLLEHYKGVDLMRGKSYFDAINDGGYASIYFLYGNYLYLISLLPTNQLLPLFPILIDFGVFVYIFFDLFGYQYENKIPLSKGMYVLFAWFSTIGFKLAISGIRCVLAVALISLGVYQFMMNKKHRILKLIVTVFFGLQIHAFTLIILLIFVVTRVKSKKIVLAILFAVTTFGVATIDLLARKIMQVNAYFAFSLEKVTRYLYTYSPIQIYQKSGLGFVTVYVGMIVISIFLFAYSRAINHKISSDDSGRLSYIRHISNYSSAVAVVALGLCSNYLFIERMMYFEAYALTMLLCLDVKLKKNYTILMLCMIPVLLWVFLNNDITTFIVNYTRAM